jgi:tyrosyl-tRNA synthetase
LLKNSEIIEKVTQQKLIEIFSKISVSSILQRDDFRKRLAN